MSILEMDTREVVSVWERVAKLVGGLGCTSHKERLRELDLLSLQRGQKRCWYCYCEMFNGGYRGDGTRLLRTEQ